MTAPPWWRRGLCRRDRRGAWAFVAVGLLVLGTAVCDGRVAEAAFLATTTTSGSLSAAATFPTYLNAVAADTPWAYHQAEEAASAWW